MKTAIMIVLMIVMLPLVIAGFLAAFLWGGYATGWELGKKVWIDLYRELI